MKYTLEDPRVLGDIEPYVHRSRQVCFGSNGPNQERIQPELVLTAVEF